MNQLSIRTRLVALVITASVVVAVMGALALWTSARVSRAMGAMQEQRVQALASLDVIGRALERQRSLVLATIGATNDIMLASLESAVAKDAETIPGAVEAIRARTSDAGERALVEDLATRVAACQGASLRAVLDHLRKGQFIEADVSAQQQHRPQVDAASQALDRAIQLHLDRSRQEYEASQELIRTQTALTLIATLVVFVVGVTAAVVMSRGLQRALGAHEAELALGARQFADGRLGHRIRNDRRFGESIAASLNAMSSAVAGLVAGVAKGAREVAAASCTPAR